MNASVNQGPCRLPARIPLGLDHPSDKNTRHLKELEHVPFETSMRYRIYPMSRMSGKWVDFSRTCSNSYRGSDKIHHHIVSTYETENVLHRRHGLLREDPSPRCTLIEHAVDIGRVVFQAPHFHFDRRELRDGKIH
jgi:hypothetical protein